MCLMQTFLRILATCACLLAGPVLAQAKTDPFFVEASDCTAALKARVVERMNQPRSPARDQAVLGDTELGFVFIGVAYKKGLRNPEADQMLVAAEQRWTHLRRSDQLRRQTQCTTQAQQLMRDISGLERFIVKNRAQARVDRLLQKEQQAGAGR